MNKLTGKWLSLIFFLGICIVMQAVASMLTFVSVNEWYQTLEKPSWTPPGWVFGPVWTFLYSSMGTAAWLIWEQRKCVNIQPALILFGIQLFLNGLWSGIFFAWQNIEAALCEIVVLWIAILWTMICFWNVRRLAGVLFLPYLIWVSYAALLTFAIWRLNP
ncbi:MAG: tryptophan-rich sensory protein [Candidatus Omnitrophota bacterium]|jgi:tryptophan-rich sensory protein|nr:MAG: tryptophan-rich sensory protein [Candidatus Omnitrophota bacterium]